MSSTCSSQQATPNGNQETHVLHDADRLLRLGHELVLLGLDLGAHLLAQVGVRVAAGGRVPLPAEREPLPARPRLGRVEPQPRALDALARALGELELRVERRRPARQEARLHRRVLPEPRLAHLLLRDGVLLQRRRQRLLGAGLLGFLADGLEGLRAGERGARHGVVERLGLRLSRGRGRHGGGGLAGAAGGGEERHLLGDRAAEVIEGLAQVGRVVVRLVRVLRAGAGSVWRNGLGGGAYVTCSIFWWTCFSASTRFSSSR